MSSFFLPSKLKGRDNRKRKKKPIDAKKIESKPKKQKKEKSLLNEEVASDSDNEESVNPLHVLGVDDNLSDEEETAPEKRLRLAKEYLAELEEQERDDKDTVDYDAIAHRLKDEVLEQSGKLHKKVADQYAVPSSDSILFYRGHKLSVTSLCVSPNDRHVYTGSKDCCIIKWNIESGNKEAVFPGHRKGIDGVVGHSGHVLALAITSDGKYLASGGTDKQIHIWNAITSLHVHTFRGHKDAVSGLVFRQGTHELYSCSFDRTVKIWNVDEFTYVETLFGHQDAVVGIDCLSRERPVTAGANDKTIRAWKVIEESQLVFHGHKASIDVIKMINENHFISGSQDGSLGLWSVMKKKPQALVKHHMIPSSSSCDHWVTSVTTLPFTDLLASGSSDGFINLWKCGDSFRSLEHLCSIPVCGFVNCLSFSKKGNILIAGIGQEHKSGRWWKNKDCKNGIILIPLSNDSS